MSLTDSIFPEKEFDTIHPSPASNLLSLNEVFRESMKKAQAAANSLHVIVRCENLPQVNGGYHQLSLVFDQIFNMIFSHIPAGSRLFLYVDCTEYNGDVADPFLPKGMKRYLIRFHTNIAASSGWQKTNDPAISVCKQLLSELNGNLAVNSVSSAGCLFSISLPGKFE